MGNSQEMHESVGAPPRGAVDFFVSYTGADEAWAEWIAWQLAEAGHSVRFQKWHCRPTDNFVLFMENALKDARRFLAVLSPRWMEKIYPTAEWTSAYTRDPTGEKRFIAIVRIDDAAPPELLKPRVFVDVFGKGEAAARGALLGERGITHGLKKQPGPDAEAVKRTPPDFPGRLAIAAAGVAAGAGDVAYAEDLADLPCLCDRENQEKALADAIRSRIPGRPVFCVLHGDAEEAHEKFVSRLVRFVLPQELKIAQDRILCVNLNRKLDLDSAERLADDLTFQLGKCQAPFAGLGAVADIPERLAQPGAPNAVVVAAMLRTTEIPPNQVACLSWFDAYLGGIRGIPADRVLLFVLQLKYEPAGPVQGLGRLFAIFRGGLAEQRNREIRKLVGELASSHPAVLPELPRLTHGDVDRWKNHDLVQPHLHVVGERWLNELFGADAALPMGRIYPRLQQLLGCTPDR